MSTEFSSNLVPTSAQKSPTMDDLPAIVEAATALQALRTDVKRQLGNKYDSPRRVSIAGLDNSEKFGPGSSVETDFIDSEPVTSAEQARRVVGAAVVTFHGRQYFHASEPIGSLVPELTDTDWEAYRNKSDSVRAFRGHVIAEADALIVKYGGILNGPREAILTSQMVEGIDPYGVHDSGPLNADSKVVYQYNMRDTRHIHELPTENALFHFVSEGGPLIRVEISLRTILEGQKENEALADCESVRTHIMGQL